MNDKQTGIELKLVGEDGNAFAILARARLALLKNGRRDLMDGFIKKATGGDYDHLLATCCDYFNVV